jgi:hypothetical protein
VQGGLLVNPAMRTAQAAGVYFVVMLSFGLVLSPFRDLVVRSGRDPVMAFLSQAVVTLFGLTWTAGWVARTFSVPVGFGPRLSLGFAAVAALVAADVAAFLMHSAVAPLDLVAALGHPEGGIILGALLLSAILPAIRHSSPEA